ncbi:MAG: DNA-processing protein DprA [Spirochaetota bacterium]
MIRDNAVLVAIDSITFLTTKEKILLTELIDSLEIFRALTIVDLESIIMRPVRGKQFDPVKLMAQAENTAHAVGVKQISIIYYWDSRYPPQLREIWDPPYLLYSRGTIPDYNRPMVGVVGTRFPSGKALKAAFHTGLELGFQDIAVVSGLAKGIDSAAHKGNSSGGGRTVAVLGCGIDRIYPREHKNLAVEIISKGGLILSEYPPGVPPLKYNFPARNRIISGMSRSVVIIQAPEKSGALITADYALEQGRDLFVHADGLAGKAGAGTSSLAEDGACVIEGADDIFKDWGWKRIAREVPAGNRTIKNSVSLVPGLKIAKLLEEELAGKLYKHHGEYFRRG